MKKILGSIVAIVTLMLSLTGCTAAGAAPAGAEGGGMTQMILMMVILFAVFYFMMIRPENKRKKIAQEMRDSVQVGDKITTIGGMIGRVVHVSDDKLTFETSEDRVRIEVTKWAISSNEGRGANKEKVDSEEAVNN